MDPSEAEAECPDLAEGKTLMDTGAVGNTS